MNTQMHPEPAVGVRGEAQPAVARTDAATGRPTTALDRWIGARVQRSIEPASVRLVLWDGSCAYDARRRSVGDLIVRDRLTLLEVAKVEDNHVKDFQDIKVF